MLKSLTGIARRWSSENVKPLSHVRIFLFIERGLFDKGSTGANCLIAARHRTADKDRCVIIRALELRTCKDVQPGKTSDKETEEMEIKFS